MGKKKKKKRGDGGGGGGRRSGMMSGMRSGFKGVVGTGKSNKKESPLGRVVTYLLLAAAVGMLLYRFVL